MVGDEPRALRGRAPAANRTGLLLQGTAAYRFRARCYWRGTLGSFKQSWLDPSLLRTCNRVVGAYASGCWVLAFYGLGMTKDGTTYLDWE